VTPIRAKDELKKAGNRNPYCRAFPRLPGIGSIAAATYPKNTAQDVVQQEESAQD
jgi:hypothetical protein